jgi:hypothetical protein
MDITNNLLFFCNMQFLVAITRKLSAVAFCLLPNLNCTLCSRSFSFGNRSQNIFMITAEKIVSSAVNKQFISPFPIRIANKSNAAHPFRSLSLKNKEIEIGRTSKTDRQKEEKTFHAAKQEFNFAPAHGLSFCFAPNHPRCW